MSLAPPRPSPLAPGFKLDRYELLCPIAEGGMASVWIARQTGKHGFRKLVAIKTILPKFASEPKFQRMFVDEARIASRIEHANVAQILDVGEQHDVTYLVMEYVDGDALHKIHRAAQKKGGLVPPGILLRVMADVCGGLHAAHDLRDEQGALLGVVHRDVSPQNVLVTTRGVAKLIDFGIAKARDRLAGDTNIDQLKGKVLYMAPEQALGRSTDRRADVWAVGAVLYHLLAGKPPFQGDNEIQTLFLLSNQRPAAPLPPTVPEPVAAAVMRALSPSPDTRFATAALLQQALEEAMAQAGLSTPTSAVATYLEEAVGDHAQKRRESIMLGLSAADEREKVADIMRSNAETSGPSSAIGASRASAELGPESSGSASGQTLGTAAMALPTIERRRGRTIAVLAAVGGLGAAVALGVLGTQVVGSSAARAPLPAAAFPPPSDDLPPAAAPPAARPTAPPAATAQTDTSTTAEKDPPTAAVPAALARQPRAGSAASPQPRMPTMPVRPAPAVKRRVNDGF